MKAIFRQLRARKAKYGFVANLHAANLIEIGQTIKDAKQFDPALHFEMNLSYGNAEVKVYTNSEEASDFLLAAYTLSA